MSAHTCDCCKPQEGTGWQSINCALTVCCCCCRNFLHLANCHCQPSLIVCDCCNMRHSNVQKCIFFGICLVFHFNWLCLWLCLCLCWRLPLRVACVGWVFCCTLLQWFIYPQIDQSLSTCDTLKRKLKCEAVRIFLWQVIYLRRRTAKVLRQ